MLEHDLLATSWTWAGDESVRERVHAVGAAGFAGLSLVPRRPARGPRDDGLRRTAAHARRRGHRLGPARTARPLVDVHEPDRGRGCRPRCRARGRGDAQRLAGGGARRHVVARGLPRRRWPTTGSVLADQAAAVGAQLVLEPEPWSNLPTIERASRFVAAAGHPNGGLLIDAMHALRGGSTLASIRQGVAPGVLAAVELSDGLLHTPSGMTLAEESRDGTVPARRRSVGPPRVRPDRARTRVRRAVGRRGPDARRTGRCPSRDALRTAAAATRAVLDAADAYGAPAAPAMPSTPAPTSAVDFEPRTPAARPTTMPSPGRRHRRRPRSVCWA